MGGQNRSQGPGGHFAFFDRVKERLAPLGVEPFRGAERLIDNSSTGGKVK